MLVNKLKEEVMTALKDKPKEWRDGQFVFNYINKHYGVARKVQFEDGVDCFYDDNSIDSFIEHCAKYL